MKKNKKYRILLLTYFPFQLAIALILSPILTIAFAGARADHLAFTDTYATEDNPMINKDGPLMRAKKAHCWLIRFLLPWLT